MTQLEIIDNQINDFDFGGQNQIVNQQEQNNQVNPTSVDQADKIEPLSSDPRPDASIESQNAESASLGQKEKEEDNESKKSDKLKDRLY